MGRVRAERAALAAVVILTLVLRVPSAISHAILGYDDGVYLASVGAMRRGELPFREVYSSQGPAFLAILRAGDLATASASWGPRLAPLVAGIACTLIAYRLAARLSGTPGGLLAGFLCATSGGLLYSTTRIESDGIAAALGAAAVLAACAPGRRRVLATGLLVGLGLSVKSVLVVPAAVAAAVLVWRRVGPAAAAWMTAVAAATVALLFAVWGWPGVWAQFVTLHLRVHGHIPPGARLEDLGQGLWHLDRWLVALVVTGVVSAGIAVARHGSGRDGDSSGDRDLTIALLVWIAGSAAALAVMDPLYRQHFALITVPAAVLVARLRPPMAVVAVVLVVLVRGQAHGADWRLSTPKVTPSEQAMVEVLRRVTPPGSLLISDEPALGWMAERSSPGWLVDTSHVRIDAGELTATEALDAATSPGVCSVLYWTGRLDGLPGLRPGLLEQYRSVWRDGSRELLVRDSCLADGDAPLVRAATPGHT